MRPTSHIFILCSLLLLVSFVKASLGDGKVHLAQPIALARRQNREDTTADGPSRTEDPTITEAPTETGDSEETGRNTDGNTDTTAGTKDTGTRTTNPRPTSVPFDAPAGGIKLIEPAITDGPTYIKIGTTATFKWNYTSLLVSPTAVDAVAYCSKNDHSYTISGNMTVAPTVEIEWDTGAYRTSDVPLLTEDYTLMVYDNSKDPSTIPGPGELGSQNQFVFGMYYPQPYTPRQDFVCPGCNSAVSDMERQALKFIVGMSAVTVLSFTWFVTGVVGLL
ncbi:hypothetical protein RJZ56_003564 [Blastomyces dermatitidis]|uniref:DUF7137 domain-containing protein n=2 Tax=Ajellomyces dermatitidis TaxID=5039 RepID=F2T656_AJEDA|nr:uncharacterized protein BDCG_07135 [Blastomyces dermatitidis ER-3]EEQ92015.1 hypothetical protein BDCG_07135 [Blastomyces dermatitidis ER-3]EGE78719.1 hypothetical protein BDDG_01656 [Blastomyces dermatitidis ATCC 18188]EQL28339.1 hypothetical protein BDFG_08913 [Blastomyces dermatitidis ATCC 26199]